MINLRVKLPSLTNLVFLVFVFWFVSNLPGWILSEGGPPPVLSYLVFLGFAGLVAVMRSSQELPLMRRIQWQRSRAFWLWIFAFVFWTICNYLYSSQSAVATQRLITWLETAAIMAGFLLLLGYRNGASSLGATMVLLVLLSTSLNLFDFFIPTFSSVPGRAAGFYFNPNASGFVSLLTVTVALFFVPIPMRWLLLALSSIGIFITFSRGAWAVLFLSISWLFMKGFLGMRRQRSLIGLLAIAAVGVFAYTILSGSLAEFILNTPLQHYLDSNTLSRLGMSQFATDFSANEREAVAQLAINKFLSAPNPLFGYGLAYTYEWEKDVSTHNMYLLFLVEGGIAGLIMYLSLFAILWRNASAFEKLLLIQIMLYGFFSHNILDSPSRVFFLALIGSGALKMTQWSETGMGKQG